MVDIAPLGSQPFAPPLKKQMRFLKMFRCTAVREGQIASDLSIMEELFEENSAELTERQVHKFCSSSVLADKNTRTELHFGRSSSAFVERPCPNMRSFPPGFHS